MVEVGGIALVFAIRMLFFGVWVVEVGVVVVIFAVVALVYGGLIIEWAF